MRSRMSTDEESARLPGKLAMIMHPHYRGKIEVTLKAPVRDFYDFSIWYTPGVAEPSKAIQKDPEKSYEYTNRWNTIAVISDGSRVLGLGNVGPEAAMPVMEGKSLLFKYLGGVDAFPLCLATQDTEEIIKTVKILEPSLGGINLEDIETPKCFEILERLRAEMNIPVWHDDQQGTATITVAGVMNALKIVGKRMDEAKFLLFGAGAANLAIARLLIMAGVRPGNMVILDSKGTLGLHREELKEINPEKWKYAQITNAEGIVGGPEEAFPGSDVLIAASKPGPGTIKKEWVAKMADDSIVFASANPIPEIWPWEAKEAGARIIATGRSDFPNQINNSLGFPGIFRGTLDVRAKTITDTMCIAAARELAALAEERGLNDEYIVPTMDDWEVFPREAAAVGVQAIKDGVARLKLSHQELLDRAFEIIKRAREQTKVMMREGFIPPAPPGTEPPSD